jgi:hypothetical protein
MATPKVKLGNAPKSFKKPVAIVLLSGVTADIEMNFIYRTRSEFAALVDEKIASDIAAENAVLGESESAAPAKTVADWFKEADQGGAKFVLKIADGWDLDDPFNEKSLLQLEDENPGALAAIAAKYRQSVAETRVKNS